jgi:pSer/pThr/pTyr-binding forkhead associated (FHA) protein
MTGTDDNAASHDPTLTVEIGALDEVSDITATVEPAAFGTLSAGTALLVVTRGPNAGSRFLLDQDVVTCGRHPESDVFLDDVTVSRRHAEFRRDGLNFIVADVCSLNGTFVNRERIESALLASGDEVQVGKFRLAYLTGHRSGE